MMVMMGTWSLMGAMAGLVRIDGPWWVVMVSGDRF
jgi:hypothetical protein